ncbi:MAG: argininosuccinate synthase, partial [Candidatus Dormibacteraceae bacterium]
MLTEQKLGKVVLAYSGGLDTSVCLHWLREQGWEVVTLTIDLGEKKDLDQVQKRALQSGATAAYVIDAKRQFLEHFAWPTLQAGAVYEKEYPLATAIGRPVIAALLVQVARQEGAQAVAHGCTGKGNDQVRFDVATAAIAPELRVIAPVRDWKMNREEELEYAERAGLEVERVGSKYSVDQNLWGRSIETGVLEDPWSEPPADVYEWTKSPEDCPKQPRIIELGFREGVPISLDGQELNAVELVERLNALGGE